MTKIIKQKAPWPSSRIFFMGMTGSGKTTHLRELAINRHPRVIVLAHTMEWGEPDATTLDELRAVLKKRVGADRWRVVATLDDDDVTALAQLLLPRNLNAPSFSAVCGGVALAIDEVAEVAGRGCVPDIARLWRLGRHVGLSIFAATQRPADVVRSVTAMSNWLGICRTFEPRDLDYLRQILPAHVYGELNHLPELGALLWDTVRREGVVIDRDFRAVRVLTGALLPSSTPGALAAPVAALPAPSAPAVPEVGDVADLGEVPTGKKKSARRRAKVGA